MDEMQRVLERQIRELAGGCDDSPQAGFVGQARYFLVTRTR